MKPWDPPEERLYPVLDDLLEDWLATFHPPFDGRPRRWAEMVAAGTCGQDSPRRNQIPFNGWMSKLTLKRASSTSRPETARIFPSSSFRTVHVCEPTAELVAKKVGLKTRALMRSYDLGIIGAGPAGLAAAVYGASEGLTTVMIERGAGGQAGSSSRIENYLGFPPD